MLLQEINAEGEQSFELANIVKYFPKTYLKIIHQLVGKPHKLKYQGLDLFDEDGDGPALDGAVAEVKRQIDAGDCKVDINLPTGMRVDLEYQADIKDVQHVWTAYEPKSNKLLLGFDGWINEDDFNAAWDKYFEEQTGEEFNYDNEEHEEIFSRVHRNYLKIGFYGLLYEVEIKPSLEIDAEFRYYSDRGFFKGTLNDPFVKTLGYIEL